MIQWLVLFQKELLELWRNYKWVWVPMVFIFLGIMQPVVTYYMPQILESVGGLPEGSIIEIPMPAASEVLAETLGQYNTLGLLVLVLAFMGTIASERNSGVAGMILVKPVSYTSYVTAKWAAAALLTCVSIAAGFAAAWVYTVQLFEMISLGAVAGSFVLFCLWFALIVTVTILFSAALRAQAAAAFVALLLAAAFSIISSLFAERLVWSPGLLPSYAGTVLFEGKLPTGAWPAVMLTLLLIAVLLVAAASLLRSKELGRDQ